MLNNLKNLSSTQLLLGFFALLIIFYILKTYFNNNNKVLENYDASKQLSLLLFYTDWCGHCNKFKNNELEPLLNYLKQHNIQFNPINGEGNEQIVQEYSVKGFPTILFKYGDDTIEYVGENTATEIIKFIEKL